MLDEPETSSEALIPAYALVLTGVIAGAPLEKLRDALSRMLGLDAQLFIPLIGKMPFLLAQSENRAKLVQRQEQLTRSGCRVELQPVWKYQHWTLADGLKRRLEQLIATETQGVFALLYIKPTPGIGNLQAAAANLVHCEAYPLNHGQLLLELDVTSEVGAGRRLQELQETLLNSLSRPQPLKDAVVLSSLVLMPEDAREVTSVFDCLSGRLLESARIERPADQALPKRVLERVIAGRPWGRLLDHGLSPADERELSAEQLAEIKLHWPWGCGFSGTARDNGRSKSAVRLIEQFNVATSKRLDRCWALLHDSKPLDSLPSLPQIALDIYDLAQDTNCDAQELCRLVASDAGLATRILSMVNSTYYGLRQKVDNLSHALVILGLREISELALTLSSRKVFDGVGAEAGHRLWRHSSMTAEVASALGKRMSGMNSASLFAAALLHDVGKIALYSLFPEEMRELEHLARHNKLPMHELEREYFGHDHATLGAVLLRTWGLPENLCREVETHHGPLPGETKMGELAAVIGLADHLAHRLTRTESWSDTRRVRVAHIQALAPYFGEVPLEQLDTLLQQPSENLRSSRL